MSYYWSCPADQGLSLSDKFHLPKLTQEYSDGAISDNPFTSQLLLSVPGYTGQPFGGVHVLWALLPQNPQLPLRLSPTALTAC